jgi:hypothetical protein
MGSRSDHTAAAENTYRPSLLLDLAAELLHQIAEEFRVDEEHKTLYNLCLASKILRDVAQPALFNLFSIPESTETSSVDAVYQVAQSVVQFTRTVLQREDLAAMVRGIGLDFYGRANHEMPQLETRILDCHGSGTRSIRCSVDLTYATSQSSANRV